MYLYVKLNWDASRFLPAESKDCMNFASYEYRNMSARRGAQFVPMGMQSDWNHTRVSSRLLICRYATYQ